MYACKFKDTSFGNMSLNSLRRKGAIHCTFIVLYFQLVSRFYLISKTPSLGTSSSMVVQASGSTKEEIVTAVSYGVVKMNVDTCTQFAYLIGIRVSK